MSNPQPEPPIVDPAPSKSGPRVARLFHRCVGVVGAAAFLSLLSQLDVLLGAQGLRPVAELIARARAQELGILELPTLFWLSSSDAALHSCATLGALSCVLAATGMWPRVCLPLAALLYQSFAAVGDAFLAFQWDNMLVEVLLLSAFVPSDRPSPGAHLVMRLMLFKLYFESGIAKWQSHLGDWHDGSAMTFYYETAPLPAPLAWHAHHLPESWHRLESWFALVLELLIPFLIFGPRWGRLTAFASFTLFQIVNTATANYGFFTYLSVTLHLFLLSDADLAATAATLRSRLGFGGTGADGHTPAAAASMTVPDIRRRLQAGALRALSGGWVIASLAGAAVHFGGDGALASAARPLYGQLSPLRVANVYHLFGHITRQRIEPEFQTLGEAGWSGHDLHHKPGDLRRGPPLVAPHQPRVDFRLWFYGLGHRRGLPRYVRSVLEKLCESPQVVQPLFVSRLPAAPDAVRIQLYRYHFTDPDQRAATGAIWQRTAEAVVGPIRCRPR